MNDPELLAKALALLGRRQIALDDIHDNYNNLLQVLAKVSSGEYKSEWVSVDLFGRTWRVDIPAPEPVIVQPENCTVADTVIKGNDALA